MTSTTKRSQETVDARRAFLGVLAARVVAITEMELAGASACGLLCAGGSERRACTCAGPHECVLKQHPFYAVYVSYRGGQMNKRWRLPAPSFTAPKAGTVTLIRSSYDSISGEYVFDTETLE